MTGSCIAFNARKLRIEIMCRGRTVGNPVNIARVTEIEAETESRRNHVVNKAKSSCDGQVDQLNATTNWFPFIWLLLLTRINISSAT